MNLSPFLFGNKNKQDGLLSRQRYQQNQHNINVFGKENPFLRKQPLIKNQYRHQDKYRKYLSLNKYGSQNRRTYLPPSKADIKQKLRQLDQESRKRQIYQQEKSILNQYGVQALRYSNISTTKQSFFQNQHKILPRTDRLGNQSSYYSRANDKIDDYLNYSNNYSKGDQIRRNPQNYTNKLSYGQKKQRKSERSLHKSRSSQFNPYDSISYTSNYNGIDQVIQKGNHLDIGNFEQSFDDEFVVKDKNRNSNWQYYGCRKQNKIIAKTNYPLQFEFKNRTFHRLQTLYI